MVDNVSVRKSLSIGPVDKDNRQNITIYDYKTHSNKTFNAPKENVDQFVDKLANVKRKSGKTIGITTLIGSTGLAAIGVFSKSRKVLKTSLGLVMGAISGAFIGVAISGVSGSRGILKAQASLLENK